MHMVEAVIARRRDRLLHRLQQIVRDAHAAQQLALRRAIDLLVPGALEALRGAGALEVALLAVLHDERVLLELVVAPRPARGGVVQPRRVHHRIGDDQLLLAVLLNAPLHRCAMRAVLVVVHQPRHLAVGVLHRKVHAPRLQVARNSTRCAVSASGSRRRPRSAGRASTRAQTDIATQLFTMGGSSAAGIAADKRVHTTPMPEGD